MEGGAVRVRLVFWGGILSKGQKRVEKLNKCWLLINTALHPTIADVASHLTRLFHLSPPLTISLSIDGFVLPPFESTSILKDRDLISVERKKRGTLDEIVKVDEVNLIQGEEVVEKNLGDKYARLLDGHLADKNGGYQNENEKQEVNVGKGLLLAGQSADVFAGSKKRKTSKKLRNGTVKSKGRTLTETAKVANGRKLTDTKATTEKQRVDEELEKATPNVYQIKFQEKQDNLNDCLLIGNNSAVKAAVSQKRKASRELDSPNGRKKKKQSVLFHDTETDCQAKQNEPCHSPRVGQHNRERDINVHTNKCRGVSSGMNVENFEKVSELDNEHEGEKAPARVKENGVFVEPLPIPKGVSVIHENGTESVDVPLTFEGTTKKISRSTRRIYEKRKFKKELKAEAKELLAEKVLIPHMHSPEKDTDINQYHPNGVIVRPGHIRFEPYESDRVVQQSGAVVEKNQSIKTTSKRKNRKLGEKKIREYCTRSKCKYSGGEYQQAEAIIEKGKSLDNLNEFNRLPLLTSCPKEGDVIAYRVMEHTENGSILSSYRVGKTLRLDNWAKTLLLTSVEDNAATTITSNNGSWEQHQDNSIDSERGYIEIDVASLYDVRIVKYAPGNKVDVWDSLSQASSVKNSLLTRKKEWGKVGPNTNSSINGWLKTDPTTTSSINEWRKTGPTTTSPKKKWGDAVPKITSSNTWGKAASNTTWSNSKWEKACPNSTSSKQDWCKVNPSTTLSNNEWAKVGTTTTSSDNSWEKRGTATTSSDKNWDKMVPNTPLSKNVWGKARPATSSWKKEWSNAGPNMSPWSSKFCNDKK